MEINDVKFEETSDIKVGRVGKYFNYVIIGNECSEKGIYVAGASRKKYSFLGISFTRSAPKKLLGILASDNDDFEVYNRANLPMAAILVKKLSLELGKEIPIILKKEDGELVEINGDDPTWLNLRRQFLEQEQQRIESELADVHKKLQALEGGNAPYRALSAVEFIEEG